MAWKRKVFESTADEINRLQLEGLNINQIAEKMNLNPKTVSRYYHGDRSLPQSKPHRGKNLTPEVKQKINELYDSGKNISEVARELGMPRATVGINILNPRPKLTLAHIDSGAKEGSGAKKNR